MSPRWSCAVLKRTDAAQKLPFLAAEQGDIDDRLSPGQHGKQAQKQDLVERMGYLAVLAVLARPLRSFK
jgi:hypothetical protein